MQRAVGRMPALQPLALLPAMPSPPQAQPHGEACTIVHENMYGNITSMHSRLLPLWGLSCQLHAQINLHPMDHCITSISSAS
jgi:hypothetical protein